MASVKVVNRSEVTIANESPLPSVVLWIGHGPRIIWIYRPVVPAVINEEEFLPGSATEKIIEWNQDLCADEAGSYDPGPPLPGTYTARALWRADGGTWWTDPVIFEIY